MSPRWRFPLSRKRQQEAAKPGFTGVAASEDKVRYALTGVGGNGSNLVVFCPDGTSWPFPHDHPNFKIALDQAIEGVKESDKYSVLFDVSQRVKDLFGVITDRVRVAEGVVYFDEKQVHNAVSEQILRFMEEGIQDFVPLAKFMENIADNPNENSRNQLYDWLELHQLAIDNEGFVVCFKGLKSDYTPSQRGPGIVNGVDQGSNALLDYTPGNTVSILRDKCDENPNNTCSVGLHVANRRFADNFHGAGRSGKVVEVRVNPRDFVSVTADSNREKIRCCRLRVVGDAPPADHFNSALRVGV